MMIGEDAVPSYRPSDFGAKNNLAKFVIAWAAASRQLHPKTNKINAGAMGVIRLGCAAVGKRRGGAI